MNESEHLNSVLLITTSCLTGIALLVLSVRVALQVLKHCDIWWDSYVLIASWILLLVGTILTNLTVDPDFDGPNTGLHQVPEWLFGGLSRFLVVSSTALSKTSYCLTILRLIDYQNAEPRIRKFWWIILLILVCVNVTTWPAALFPLVECLMDYSSASSQFWTSRINVILGVAGSGCSGAADVILALLPFAIIYEHAIPRLRKPLAIFASTMGVIAAVAAFTQCSQIMNNDTTALTSAAFVFVISSFAESTLTMAVAASLPIHGMTFHVSNGSSAGRTSQARSRASTAFWHDRGRAEDMEGLNNTYYRQRPNIAQAVVVSPVSTPDRQERELSHDLSRVPYGQVVEISAPAAPRDSKTSLFERTWSTISSALHDLEPLWAHRRMEAAMHRHVRPYTPSFYSSRTMDDDRLDGNHIINRLSDIVEESWRDRSILKTPEPAALMYTTERTRPSYRGVQSDWDIENGSMI